MAATTKPTLPQSFRRPRKIRDDDDDDDDDDDNSSDDNEDHSKDSGGGGDDDDDADSKEGKVGAGAGANGNDTSKGPGRLAAAIVASDDDSEEDDMPLSALFGTMSVARIAAMPATSAASTPLADAVPSAGHAPIDVPLRDYQTALLKDADRLFHAGQRAVLAYLPTGGGKTRVGAAAIASWALGSSSSAQALFVVNRRSLLDQTRTALLELGFAPSTVAFIGGEGGGARGGGNGAIPAVCAQVHIAMVQSLHKRYLAVNNLDSYALAVIDECHAAAAPSYLALLDALPTSGRVLGLTATPFRSKPGENLASVFPAAAWGPSVSRLITQRSGPDTGRT